MIRVAAIEALLATGDQPAARLVATTARARLQARAEHIPDVVCRHRFLTRDGDNARLLELAASLEAGGAPEAR